MQRIVILTGSGISAESGLGTFRDENGLWTQYDLNEVATPEGFANDPVKVHSFYNARRANLLSAVPNAAHTALARLQRVWPGQVTLVTQNVDDLHERAGATAVIHMHGELKRALCSACGHGWRAPDAIRAEDPCPACHAPAIRPAVVWFGEEPYRMDEILAVLSACDRFIAIGTSGNVYPAAGFVGVANAAGAQTLELNLEPSDTASAFASARYGKATKVVPAWVGEMLAAGR